MKINFRGETLLIRFRNEKLVKSVKIIKFLGLILIFNLILNSYELADTLHKHLKTNPK